MKPSGLTIVCAAGLAMLLGCTAHIQGGDNEPGGTGGTASAQQDGGAGQTGGGAGAGAGMAPGGLPTNECGPAAARIRRLTRPQFAATVAALLPGVAVSPSFSANKGPSGFRNAANKLELTQPDVEQLFALASQVSQSAFEQRTSLSPCLDVPSSACVREFLPEFLARAFRRPATPEEVERYAGLFDADLEANDGESAFRQLIRVVLMSPHFLFGTELGRSADVGTTVPLTSHELAAAVAYLLTDAPPDAELRAAADSGELSAQTLRPYVEHLLQSPQGGEGLRHFFREYLDAESLEQLAKDPEVFPTFTVELAPAMARELDEFIHHVLFVDDGRFETLMTANYSVVNAQLAEYYGIEAPAGDFAKVNFPAGQRAGLLTLGPITAMLAKSDEVDPIARGRFVREHLLGQSVPPPPPNVEAVFPPLDRSKPLRARLDEHRADPSCASCHDLMDPTGYALSHFDGDGLFRTEEAGKPIDATGVIANLDGMDVAVADHVELARALSRSPSVHAYLTNSLYRYLSGSQTTGRDACALEAAQAVFRNNEGRVVDLVMAVLETEGFFERVLVE